MLRRVLMGALVITIAALALFTEMDADATVAVEDANCVECQQVCMINWHTPCIFCHTAEAQGGGNYTGAHEVCVDGMSCAGHPSCGTGMTPEEQAEEAAFEMQLEGINDADDMIALLDQYPNRITLNLDRRALQIESACDDGRIIAHLPLTSEQVAVAILKDPSLTLTAYAGE